jgi:Fe-S cluster biogenesis protein NfuA
MLDVAATTGTNDAPAQSEAERLYKLVEAAIAELRPYLKADGGDCELIAVEGNLVKVKLQGACIGCQLSNATLNGLQERLIAKIGVPLRIAQVQSPQIVPNRLAIGH